MTEGSGIVRRHTPPAPSGNDGQATSASGEVLSDVVLEEYRQSYNSFWTNKLIQQLQVFMHYVFVPIFIMVLVPNHIVTVWFTAVKCDGSFYKLADKFAGRSLIGALIDIWSVVPVGTPFSVAVLTAYWIWALVMMKILPGKRFEGPVTRMGNVPVYKDNGFLHFSVTMVAFILLTVCMKAFGHTPTVIYDRFEEFIGTLNAFSVVFCLLLYFKGRYAPSTTDHGSSGNFIFNYYCGTELYPRIFGFDVKVFTNCRFGMTIWGILVGLFALKSYELWGFVDSMFVSAVLQLVYITKFFWWEAGYMRTIDIILDNAGFCICWGCLVYVPGQYASVSLYLVNNPVRLGTFWSVVILSLGLLCIWINYLADQQKITVRSANGDCMVWGKKPELIRAKYQLETGEKMESILLACGWWGLSRHFHYIPEILLAFFWTAPALFENFMPHSYWIYLCILLVHRTYRDDAKCSKKYGDSWRLYCNKVPHRIVPYLY